jgi:hypothetical protein
MILLLEKVYYSYGHIISGSITQPAGRKPQQLKYGIRISIVALAINIKNVGT